MSKTVLYRYAILLAVFTVVYNIGEGVVSILFGFHDDTLALFGFGIDSFVEVLSGIGILHMVLRLPKNPEENRDRFERTALRITSISFYLLCAGLLFGSVWNIIQNVKPRSTLPGLIISLVSILSMWLLLSAKKAVGKAMNSQAILADAECTKTCLYLSFILLCSSVFYEIFHFTFIDIAGSIGIAFFAFREGCETWKKAKGISCCCC